MKRKSQFSVLFMIVCLFVFVAVSIALAGDVDTIPPEKKAVYLIGNLNGVLNFPFNAYSVAGDDLFHVETWQIQSHDLGPVGLAIDEASEHVFISFEGSNEIEVVDAKKATPLGSIFLYGTSDLAGMVVHQGRGHLYVVDRGENDIFVFDTTTFTSVTTWLLPTGSGAWGIDLLDDTLYVADTSNTVRWYDIDSHVELGNATLTYPAVAIAVTDYPELTIYTSAYNGGSPLSPYLTKYTVSTGIEEFLTVGTDTMGIALNPALDIAYVAADNKLHVVDTANMSIVNTVNLIFTWVPTDCLVSNLTFGGTVEKKCTSHPSGDIYKGDQVTFKISIKNFHNQPIHLLPVRDVYDTAQLSFVSSNPPADDANDDGQLDWSDLIAQIGSDLATGDSAEIDIVFEAESNCTGELSGTNTASTVSPQDDQGTTLLDTTDDFDYTIDCNCRTYADCDDALFCNGQEICNRNGSCTSPGNPCPLDDGLYCNGTETSSCNETIDECGHTGDPCTDDGVFCNGTESCDEATDSCPSSGFPCLDDGLFCNGSEGCDESGDQCTHNGDPCGSGEQCNEANDTCDVVDDDDDDSTDDDDNTTDDDDSTDDDDATDCITCQTTSECFNTLGTGWVCQDGCCEDMGDGGNKNPSDDDDDDNDEASACGG